LKDTINAEHGVLPGAGLPDKLLSSQRRKMFDAFTVFREGDTDGTVLNVGMPFAATFGNADYLAAWTDPQHRSRIASHRIAPQAGEPDGDLRLPFADGEFDWVFCGEIIEHMGGFERQYALVKELYRVARKGVFVTTSNRRHPIEFKTALPLIHWLPDAWWRRILKWSGKGAWAEPGLTLLDSTALYTFAGLLPGKPEHDVGHKRVFGMKAHFFLMIRKNSAIEKEKP
jgi:hypothetical protein